MVKVEIFGEAFELTTTAFGNSCHVILPKNYTNEKVIVLVGCEHNFSQSAKGKAHSTSRGEYTINLYKCKKCGKLINKIEK